MRRGPDAGRAETRLGRDHAAGRVLTTGEEPLAAQRGAGRRCSAARRRTNVLPEPFRSGPAGRTRVRDGEPVEKEGYSVTGLVGAARDGERVAFGSLGTFLGEPFDQPALPGPVRRGAGRHGMGELAHRSPGIAGCRAWLVRGEHRYAGEAARSGFLAVIRRIHLEPRPPRLCARDGIRRARTQRSLYRRTRPC